MTGERKFTVRNEGFVCANCGREVPPAAKSCRNHCPHCLYSMHLDVHPGDRAANCGGQMIPVDILYNPKKGYQIVHQCQRCAAQTKNIVLLDDEIQPDSMDAVLAIMKNKV